MNLNQRRTLSAGRGVGKRAHKGSRGLLCVNVYWESFRDYLNPYQYNLCKCPFLKMNYSI